MVPIVSLTDLLVTAMAFLMAAKLYAAYKKNPSATFRHFIIFFVLFALAFLFWGVPGVATKDGMVVAYFNIAAYLALYAAFAYLANLAFSFLHARGLANLAFWAVFLFGIFFVIVRLTNVQPSIPQVLGDYVYWRPQYAPWLRQLTGYVSLAVTLLSAVVFLAGGIRNRAERGIFVRSLWIAAGILFILLAASSSFIFAPTAAFLGAWAGTLFSIVGLLAMLRGILYRPRNATA